MKSHIGVVFACILLIASSSKLDAQSNFSNKTQLQLAKLAFPDADFVDLSRKVTITVEKSDEADQPFFWRWTEETERISVSNQNFFTYTVYFHDFIKDDKVNLILINDAEKKIVRPEPRVQMVEQDGLFHTNYKVKYYQQYIAKPGAILSIKSTFLVTSFAHLNDLSFGSYHPALTSEIQIEVPNDMKIRLDSLNFDKAVISRTVKTDKKKPPIF